MSEPRLLKCAGYSDPGLERENNEDRFHVDPQRGVFIVIDGIGGQAAGEVAAETALKVVRERMERPTGTVVERLREAITLANNEIYRLAQSQEDWRGMACVLTAAVVENSHVTVGHVGDTRLYKIRDAQIRKLTPDHSPTGVREDAGELTEYEAMQHSRRNEVYRDVGSSEHSPDDEDFVEIIESNFESNSALLLCSDGLTDLVTSSRILEIVKEHGPDPAVTVHELIGAANRAGGKDNITAVLIEGESFAPMSIDDDSNSAATTTIPEAPSALMSSADGEGISRSSGVVSTIQRITRSRWAFFTYGAIITVLITVSAERLFKLSFVPQEHPPTNTVRPRSLVVSQHGESEFSSISEALMKAQAGDTVEVSPGEYREQIRLKEGVTLISLRPREAVIGPIDGASAEGNAVEARDIKNARFVGFRIRGNKGSGYSVGLRITNSTIIVEDLDIADTTFSGIEIEGMGSSVLRANYIHDNSGAGIMIIGQQSPRVVQNVIVRNGNVDHKKRPGIELTEQARPDLVGNYIADNGAVGVVGLSNESKDEVIEKNLFGPINPEKESRSSNNRRRRR